MITRLHAEVADKILDDDQMENALNILFPKPVKGKTQRVRIKEAGAIAAYHNQTDVPVVPVLFSDDAAQFKHITWEQGLCFCS